MKKRPNHPSFDSLEDLMEYVEREARRRIREGNLAPSLKEEDEPN